MNTIKYSVFMAPKHAHGNPKIGVQARIDPMVLRKIDAIAEKQERSRSEIINKACAEYARNVEKSEDETAAISKKMRGLLD